MLILSLSGIDKYILTLKREEKQILTKYQLKILNYFNSPAGRDKILLLLYMDVGTGKTLTSLACGIEALRLKLFKQIIILSPKSVQNEFIDNLNLYYTLSGMPDMNNIQDKIVMIPYNANNSARQLNMLGDINNSLFIIDEAHLFMKSVIKVSLLPNETRRNVGNAKRIYDKINKLKHKKVICLTGTPSAKHPFETVPMFNLNGCNLPNNYESFSDRYIDYDNECIKNKSELINKIKGLIAYVKSDNSQRLKTSPLNIIEVEMSEPQYKQYLIDYDKELNEKGFTNKKNVYGLLFGAKSSFHAKTFEDCIYWNSNIDNNDNDRYIGEIVVNKIHCPKIIRMYNDTVKINGPCVFYFKFVRMYGVETMERKLINEGYTLPSKNEDIFNSKRKRYVLFTGSINYETRILWKRLFNDKRNKYGEYIKYLILSPSGAVGVTLKNVRYLGIGSVEFNYSAIRQIIGRVNRYNSHIDLPARDRILKCYLYIMTKNKKYYKQNKEYIDELCSRTAPGHNEKAPTIERIIYQDSIKDDKINEAFRQCLIEASI